MAGKHVWAGLIGEIGADFLFQAVAEAGWPVYQGSNNSIYQQRNFV